MTQMTMNDTEPLPAAVPMQRWTIHVKLAHKLWRTIERRHLDGFTTDGRLFCTCTLDEAKAIARLVGATRLQGNGWPTRTVGRGDDLRQTADLQYATCDRCSWTGTYKWGATINGKISHEATCYQCQGKGYQSQDDQRRNWGHTMHMIRAAFNG